MWAVRFRLRHFSLQYSVRSRFPRGTNVYPTGAFAVYVIYGKLVYTHAEQDKTTYDRMELLFLLSNDLHDNLVWLLLSRCPGTV